MKKIPFLIFTLFALTFSLTSCTKDASSEQNVEKEEITAPSGLSDNPSDFQFSIDGVIYQLPMKCSDFDTTKFTTEYDMEKMLYSEALGGAMWCFNDLDLRGLIINPSINGQPLKDCYVINMDINNYKHNETNVFFAKGIQLNVSTKDDIIEAYGEPESEKEYDTEIYLGYELYKNPDIFSYFVVDKETDRLISAHLRTAEMKPTDYLAYTDVPPVAEYIAPDKLSDKMDIKTFCLNEKYYSLPCPVSELLDNGFIIQAHDSYKDIVIPAGASQKCLFAKGDKTISTTVTNFTYSATPFENCYITAIEDNSFYNDNWPVEISPGLKVGDSEDKLLSVLEDFEYNSSTATTADKKKIKTFYWSENGNQGDWYYTLYFSFEVCEGQIITLSITNSMHPAYTE